MKKKTVYLFGIILLLCAFTIKSNDKKVIGSWKVDKVTRQDGSEKKGRKTLTFTSDHKFVSKKDNGSEMKGTWELISEGDSLKMCDTTGYRCETFAIIELSKKSLILKDDRKTYYTSRK